jgi:hypothetical protein
MNYSLHSIFLWKIIQTSLDASPTVQKKSVELIEAILNPEPQGVTKQAKGYLPKLCILSIPEIN